MSSKTSITSNSNKDSKLFLPLQNKYHASDEKRKHIDLDTYPAFCSHDVSPLPRTSHRPFGTDWLRTSLMHGKDSRADREETNMDIPLQRICLMECHHNVLGMQCHDWWRSVRNLCQCLPDVTHLRAVQTQQEEIQRCPAIYLPDSNVDSMGTILFRC